SGHGERCADDDRQENARQANLDDDHVVIAGESSRMTQHELQQVTAQPVQRNGHGAKLQRDGHNNEQNQREYAALHEEALQRQWAHAYSSDGGSPCVDSDGLASLCGSFFSSKASGCSWRASSSIAATMRGAGRLTASLITAYCLCRTASRIRQPGRVAS